MSTDLAVIEPRNDEQLAALAITINDEYRLANEAAGTAIVHAITCGEALLVARDVVPAGEWQQWLAGNVDVDKRVALRWCRLARNKHLLEDWDKSPYLALEYLTQLGIEPGSRFNGMTPAFDIDEARRLRGLGWSYRRVSEELGASRGGVYRQLNPQWKQRKRENDRVSQRRRALERKALARQELDAAVKKTGGSASVLYASLRRGALIADRALTESDDPEYREAIRSVLSHIHAAEDGIVRALRIGRRT